MIEDGWVIAGKPKGTLPEVGKTYEVRHARKGNFTLRATRVNGCWLTGVIEAGYAKAMLSYNERDEGEEITVRDSLVYLREKEDQTG